MKSLEIIGARSEVWKCALGILTERALGARGRKTHFVDAELDSQKVLDREED